METLNLEMGLNLDEEDIHSIKKFLVARGYRDITIGDSLRIIKIINFKDSKEVPDKGRITWFWNKVGKKKGGRRAENITGEDWTELVKHTKKLIPSVLYFPTFLFDFPEKIYLEADDLLDEKHKLYRTVLQDILDATGTSTNIQTHIIDRAKSIENSDKRNLESLLLSMGRHVTATIFESWNKTFNSSVNQRNIRFELDKDTDGKLYIQLVLEDTDGQYFLSERSLGFRWFFVFLLFTHYRGFRKDSSKNVLFLFDEPASNLHASAQAQLLNSFEVISKKCVIIYTTHSHHMIDPKYLDGTFVVKNEGIDYEDSEDKYNARKTRITATKYRTFVSTHPDQTNYYKPVLDVLDYQPSKLENIPNVVMLEGKTDFYTLKYFAEVVMKKYSALNFLPGTGAGTLDRPIQLYLGWGRPYLVILDSDKEGKAQKIRYSELFGMLSQTNTFTLEDVSAGWKNFAIEKLLTDEDKLQTQKSVYPDTKKYNKSQFHRAIQELLMLNKAIGFSEDTLTNMELLLSFIESRVNAS